MQIPPILQQLGGNPLGNQMLTQIKQAKALMGMMNGQQINLNTILQQNPVVQETITRYGSVDGAIQALCQQKGINYQAFMDAMK